LVVDVMAVVSPVFEAERAPALALSHFKGDWTNPVDILAAQFDDLRVFLLCLPFCHHSLRYGFCYLCVHKRWFYLLDCSAMSFPVMTAAEFLMAPVSHRLTWTGFGGPFRSRKLAQEKVCSRSAAAASTCWL